MASSSIVRIKVGMDIERDIVRHLSPLLRLATIAMVQQDVVCRRSLVNTEIFLYFWYARPASLFNSKISKHLTRYKKNKTLKYYFILLLSVLFTIVYVVPSLISIQTSNSLILFLWQITSVGRTACASGL